MTPKPKIIFIVGPTGVGKTQTCLKLADLLPAEFISADSMQVYRSMDIITDKLPPALRRKYPHHLVDVLNPQEEYNVADFCKAASSAVRDIIARKKVPVVIGGTGLYINSLLYGIFQDSSKDEGLRSKLARLAEEKGVPFLYERLKKLDPEAASKINSNDLRRIMRGLEVYEVTQKPISRLQKERKGLKEEYDVLLFGLKRQRPDLYRRIEQRVDFMVNAGLLDEVRRLLKLDLSRTAYMCIGIREMEGFIKGEYGLNEALRLLKINSRHFAKRQMTWFNKNKDIRWLDIDQDEAAGEVARSIYAQIEKAKV